MTTTPRGSLSGLVAALPGIVVALVGLLVVQDLLTPWDVDGHSVYLNLQRLVALDDALRQGFWPPRWLPAFYLGHGSPLFNYYAPLPYLLAELLLWLGATPSLALRLVYAAAVLAAGLGTQRLGHRLLGPRAGLVAGVLLLLTPYLLADLYVRAQIGELVALGVLPWLLLALDALPGGWRPWTLVRAALLTALLVLSHNIAALLLAPVALGFVLLRGWRDARRGAPWPGLAALILGLLLSAWFWLPALGELGLVQADAALTTGQLAYDQHFVTIAQLLGNRWGYGVSGPGPDDGMPLQAGPLQLLALLAGLSLLVWRRPPRWRLVLGFGLVALLALLLVLESSAPLWRVLPLLRFVQFPWRCYLLFAVGAALAGGAAAELGAALLPRALAPALPAALVAGALALSWPGIHGRHVLYDARLHRSAVFDAAVGAQVAAQPGLVPMQDFFTVERIAALSIFGTIGHEYLPAGVRRRPSTPAQPPLLAPAGGLQVLSLRQGNPLQAELEMAQAGSLLIRRFFFAGWRVHVDGQPVELVAEPETGLITLALPAGRHRLELRFGETPLRATADALSGLALLLALLLPPGVRWWRRRAQRSGGL